MAQRICENVARDGKDLSFPSALVLRWIAKMVFSSKAPVQADSALYSMKRQKTVAAGAGKPSQGSRLVSSMARLHCAPQLGKGFYHPD